MDYVRTEFGRYETAIRKRHGELLDNIEREVREHKSGAQWIERLWTCVPCLS